MKIKEALKNKFYENNGELRDYFVVLKGENGEKVGKYITFDDMLAITEDNYQKYRDYKDDQYGTELENLFVSARKLIPVDGGVTFKDKAGKYYNTKVVKEDKSVVLPRHAGVSRQIRLGIIGFPNCGKTVLEYQFNTILRPEFARNVPGFRILSDMLDFSRPRLEMEEKAMELSGGTLPDPNKKEEVSSTLSFMVKYKNQEILLEFQDVSGEEATLGRNLFYDAYIILISAEELMKENCSDDLENSITNLLYETFERQGGENIPVFVGITKSDLLQADEHLSKEMKDILAQNSLKKNHKGKVVQERHLYGYDKKYCERESKAVAQMIQNEIPNFYNALHELKEIEDVKFFALASLNYQPDGNKIDRDYLPFNIDEIFLALLAEFQLYPLKENVKSEEEDEKEDSKTLTDVLKNFVKEKKGAFYERVHHVDA